jgi:hypothetical protein
MNRLLRPILNCLASRIIGGVIAHREPMNRLRIAHNFYRKLLKIRLRYDNPLLHASLSTPKATWEISQGPAKFIEIKFTMGIPRFVEGCMQGLH